MGELMERTQDRQAFLRARRGEMVHEILGFLFGGIVFTIILAYPIVSSGNIETVMQYALYLLIAIVWTFMGILIIVSYLSYVNAKIGVHYDGKDLLLISDVVVMDSNLMKGEIGFFVEPKFIERVRFFNEGMIVHFTKDYPKYGKMRQLNVPSKYIENEEELKEELRRLGIIIE